MQKTEITPGNSVFKLEETYLKGEKAPVKIHAASIVGEFLILLGLSAIVDKIFTKNRGWGTAAALSSVALGLKITTHNINKQIPEELTFSPTNAGH